MRRAELFARRADHFENGVGVRAVLQRLDVRAIACRVATLFDAAAKSG
jgi:hypothetical protein